MKKLALELPGQYSINPVAGMPEGGASTVENLLHWGITMAFILLVIVALFFLIWAGITWISSQGDKAAIESARKKIIYAILGLIVAFSSFFILRVLGDFIGVKIINLPEIRRATPRQIPCRSNADCPAGLQCRGGGFCRNAVF